MKYSFINLQIRPNFFSLIILSSVISFHNGYAMEDNDGVHTFSSSILTNTINFEDNESYEIAKKIQEKGFISEIKKVKNKAFSPKYCSSAEKIIFITDSNDCKIVAKKFKIFSEFQVENKQLSLEYKPIEEELNELKKESCGLKFPLLMEYKGELIIQGETDRKSKGYIILSRAKGRTLREICDTIAEEEDNNISQDFGSMGYQWGTMDSFCYKNKNKRVVHPDSKLANFTYHKKTNQLYWIDVAEISFESNEYPSLKKVAFLKKELRNFLIRSENGEFNWSYRSYNFLESCTEQIVTKFILSTKKHLLALKSLYESYGAAMKYHNLNVDPLVEEYNDMFKDHPNDIIRFIEEATKVNKILKNRNFQPIDLDDYNTLNIDRFREGIIQ